MVEDLAAVLDEAVALDPAALADAESIVELHRCLARLEAITTRAAAAFEAGGAGTTPAHGRRPEPLFTHNRGRNGRPPPPSRE